MLLAIDVQYEEDSALAAGVLFSSWDSATPDKSIIKEISGIEPYEAGSFYKRELPCILDIIAEVNLDQIEAIIVDGHVFIDNDKNHGLGGYLYEELDRTIPIIGVAKRAFHKNEKTNIPVQRGESTNPLYVSAIGMDPKSAAEKVQNMHGEFRMPTLLQILDTETKKP